MVKKIEIAKAMGVSAASVTKYVKAGMPTTSAAAAIAWRDENVDPVRRFGQAMFRAEKTTDGNAKADVALAEVRRLAGLAQLDFDNHHHALRRAMRNLPRTARWGVEMDEALWARLIDVENLRRWEQWVLDRDKEAGIAPLSAAELDAAISDDEHLNHLYDIASGAIRVGKIEP